MLQPVRTVPAAVSPVTLQEAKAYLHVDGVDDDSLVSSLIDAAVAHLDGFAGVLGRCLVNQTWRLDLRDFTSTCIRLPFPNVSEAVVAYDDADEDEQTVSADLYQLLERPAGTYLEFTDAFSAPAVFDKPNAVRITLTAGYGATAEDVPAALRLAIKMLVAHWYGNREAVVTGAATELPLGVAAIIAPYRRVGV